MEFPVSVRTKLDRAQEHVNQLLGEVDAFADNNSYVFVPDHNADLTEHYLHLRLRDPFPGERWGAILGDAAHNLRSALDHLVYAVAIHESGREQPPEHSRLMFPVLDPPKPLPIGKVRTLSGPVQAAIQTAQPDPTRLVDSPLWTLDQLDIADKHRVIHVALAHGDYSSFSIKPSIPCNFVPKWNARPLNGKAPLLTLTFDRPVPEVEVGSVGSALIGIDRIDPNDPKSIIFWAVGDLMAFLRAGVDAAIASVLAATGP
jgi:hypothetical protein